jgi:hypothetical protein
MAHRRALVEQAGGWLPPVHTGRLDPEAELWQRMTARAGPTTWVERVTNVKLYALARAGVYRDRPHHEQEYWLNRIRQADDPEQSMVAATAERYRFAQHYPAGQRLMRALRPRLRRARRNRGPVGTGESRWAAGRRFKGVDDWR